ncbi:hypothetical protein HG536_0E02720 [Torulaspora globosa]|uniref:non-specific serine/threonine protein kinase n=1 Tax=Torulaspora globosa TaxID=48254 RepID=A0A7G3ZIM5_9SACH|nr:uncharacterized protein HG536_0E02720 [Torulaspora globosa]QLL33361.1 hypothetical protein HG536_0E02720 [Torulaspora globosa]
MHMEKIRLRLILQLLFVSFCFGAGLWADQNGLESMGSNATSPALQANQPTTGIEYHTVIPTALRKQKTGQTSSLSPEITVAIPSGDSILSQSLLGQAAEGHDRHIISSHERPAKVQVHRERSLENLSLSNLLLATDLEGGLHGIDRKNGKTLWSIDSSFFEPLIEITGRGSSTMNETLIVEPYNDGNIYYFSPFQGVQKLPVTINQLVASSPMHLKTDIVVDELGTVIQDEKIYTGSRSTSMYTIDLLTGEIISAYGLGTKNKKYSRDKETCITSGFESTQCHNSIVVGKSTYRLEIHSLDGIAYNVSYSKWQQNSLDTHLATQNFLSQDGIYIAPFRDKTVLAISDDFKIARWISATFPGIINGIFDIYQDETKGENILVPHPLKSPYEKLSNNEKVYLDQNQHGTWFALSSHNFPSLVEVAPMSKYSLNERWKAPSIFQNEDLTRTALQGVHELTNMRFQQIFEGGREQNDILSLPEKNSPLLIDPPADHILDPTSQKVKSIDRYISPGELEAYKLKVQEQIAQEIMQKAQGSFLRTAARFVYRVVESGFVLLFALFILLILQKFRIIMPLPVLLEKLGLIPTKDITLKDVEITNLDNDKMSNRNAAKKSEVADVEDKGQTAVMSSSSSADIEQEDIRMLGDIHDKNGTLIVDKRKRKRGARGGKKAKKKLLAQETNQDGEDLELEHDLKTLTVSDKILGYGSSGTVVFQGSFQGRPVAVKRMLLDFCDVASREIKMLTESDDHPNVVRYFCSEFTQKFLYIALELCSATLEEVIEPNKGSNETVEFELNEKVDWVDVLKQVASGVAHLHSLKIVHRDIKPQNILVSGPKKPVIGQNNMDGNIRVLLSDFGLCKRLEADQSSFHPTNTNKASGTSGWRAPELLDESKKKVIDSIISDEQEEAGSFSSFYDKSTKQRLTRAMDIFSMGCVFYYVLSNGNHPFGSRYVRDANIIRGNFDLSALRRNLSDKSLIIEANSLITQMLKNDPLERPTAAAVLNHPLFWSSAKKLEFLLKVSDRFEIERRDPPSPLLLKLEAGAKLVILNGDWTTKFEKDFMDNLGKYRKYSGSKLMDLLRALRNKYHHFMDLPEDLAAAMSPIPAGFYNYFALRFPNLLMTTYSIIKNNLEDDQILSKFFA